FDALLPPHDRLLHQGKCLRQNEYRLQITTLLTTKCVRGYRFASSLMRGVSGGDPADGARSGVPRRRLATARRWGSAPALRPLYGRGARSALGPIRMFSPVREKRPPGPKSPRWSAERRASPRDAGASHAPWARRSADAAAPARYLGAPPPLISGARSQKQNPGA